MSERKRIEIHSLEELKQLIEEKDEDTMLVKFEKIGFIGKS